MTGNGVRHNFSELDENGVRLDLSGARRRPHVRSCQPRAKLCLTPFLGVAVAASMSLHALAADRILTSDDYKLKVTTVASGLETPWGMIFLDKDRILLTEKPGRMRIVEHGALLPGKVEGLPPVRVHGQGGLLDVTTHPQFAQNGLVYWSYAGGEAGGGNVGTEVARGKLSGNAKAGYALSDVEVIFRQQPKLGATVHFGSRLVWDRDGNLFVTLGERGQMQEAQNLGVHLGKVVHLTDAGKIPAGNPFTSNANAKPEIWSWGNRNVQGAALHPTTGE